MAHFAKIDENNTVIEVIIIDNREIQESNFPDSEIIGKKYIAGLGLTGKWLQTSYNGTYRKKYASIGYTYDNTIDAFLPPAVFKSWVLNENFEWTAPIPYPSTIDKIYNWDEDKQSWVEIGEYTRSNTTDIQPLTTTHKLPEPDYEIK